VLTSSVSRIDINLTGTGEWRGGASGKDSGKYHDAVSDISSVISDNGKTSVGLRIDARSIYRKNPSSEKGEVYLSGNKSNTFSGKVELLGRVNLKLEKENGATAIQGNIIIGDDSSLWIGISDQIGDRAVVTLNGKEGTARLGFLFYNYEITESFHQLVVKGRGHLNFYKPPNTRKLFLDDLLIEPGSTLEVTSWEDGASKLLVRKDSEHLHESIKRIHFKGYDPKRISLKDYDANYWEISALPEPAVYGAVSAAATLALVYWKRTKRNRSRTKSAPTL